MLNDALKSQLQTYLQRIEQPIELVATLDGGEKSRQVEELLVTIAGMSDKITLRRDGAAPRKPSFDIRRGAVGVTFGGAPLGHEFTSLVLALLQVGGVPPKESPETIAQVKGLDGEFHFETFFSLTCQNCPDVVQALNLMAALNPKVKHTAIDGAVFQEEVERRQIMAVPSVFLNGQPFAQGRMTLEQILQMVDSGAAERDAEKLTAKDPYDVLIVGGGPASAAAAIYAARKGLRTGIVAERFGGQVLDTLAIENLISVPHTEGPQLASLLERQVREHDVDVMTPQTAVSVSPAPRGVGLSEVTLANGATLKAKSLILAPGARWRTMNVPGEDEYRNRGVAFCPHCDGPLFKGKRVAVIGGGNSGVEAAIDLAGIVAHVTLLEFAPSLRADEVLQAKLRSLRNVEIVTSAKTTEVKGDSAKVTALVYEDTRTSATHEVPLDGVFVQIGLVPNTEWLGKMLELTQRGEIVVDARGETSAPGVFAAGDATTTPYKQIVVAMGDGAKASLSAFDHLIRAQAPGVSAAA